MFGFLIGTACLIGLIKVARHGHACGHRGYGYDDGYGESRGCGGGAPWNRHRGHGGFGRRGGFGPNFFLRGAFERLDTTPGQEKVIVEAVDELKGIFKKAKGDLRGTRADFASVIRGESLDEAALADIFMKHDTTIGETRRAAVEALHKIHDALSESQRAKVADFLERGPGARGGSWSGGPYRGQWA